MFIRPSTRRTERTSWGRHHHSLSLKLRQKKRKKNQHPCPALWLSPDLSPITLPSLTDWTPITHNIPSVGTITTLIIFHQKKPEHLFSNLQLHRTVSPLDWPLPLTGLSLYHCLLINTQNSLPSLNYPEKLPSTTRNHPNSNLAGSLLLCHPSPIITKS